MEMDLEREVPLDEVKSSLTSQLPGYPVQFVNGFNHVNRDADSARLILSLIHISDRKL